MKRMVCIAVLVLISAAAAFGQEAEEPDLAALAQAQTLSLVQVEYTLRYDKGEEPSGNAWSSKCPGCGAYHGAGFEKYVKLERPYMQTGYLLPGNLVLTPDIATHSRFIDTIRVRYNGKAVEADLERLFVTENAVLLKLTKPLPGTRPLQIENYVQAPFWLTGGAEEVFYAVTYKHIDAQWKTTITPLAAGLITLDSSGNRYRTGPDAALIITPDGTPVGFSMSGKLPADNSWTGSSLNWESLSSAEYAEAIENLEQKIKNTIIRVQLKLRSPTQKAGNRFGRSMMYTSDDQDQGTATEKNVLGLVLKERVIVLSKLKATDTARLEHINLFTADGQQITAQFEYSLLDHGALTVIPDRPLPDALSISTTDIITQRGTMLLGADIRVKGEENIRYFIHTRIPGFETGRRNNVYPEIAGKSNNLFLFSLKGELLAFPLQDRYKGEGKEDAWRYSRDSQSKVTPYAIVSEVLADPAQHADNNNVPLSEEEENRLAWFGAEFQALNRELARSNNVSKHSKDGSFGALVSYVYPDSPAARAGVEIGDILLRIHVEGEPKPLNVQVDNDNRFGSQPFPWEQLDQIPEQYFEQIPSPWADVETSFIRSLTDYGFDKQYRAEMFINGEIVFKDMVIEQSPPHFVMAKKFKSDLLGVTVKEITYEANRYFQRVKTDPGVIISKVKPGSKASVSGIKPYEIITHINNQPVGSINAFKVLLKEPGEYQLNIKRMMKSRVVKVKLEPEAEEK